MLRLDNIGLAVCKYITKCGQGSLGVEVEGNLTSNSFLKTFRLPSKRLLQFRVLTISRFKLKGPMNGN